VLGVAIGGGWRRADFTQGVAKSRARSNQVRFVEAEGGGKRQVDVAKEVLQPGSTKGYMVELSCELLRLFHLEGAPMRALGCLEEVDGAGDEVRWGADGHAA